MYLRKKKRKKEKQCDFYIGASNVCTLNKTNGYKCSKKKKKGDSIMLKDQSFKTHYTCIIFT